MAITVTDWSASGTPSGAVHIQSIAVAPDAFLFAALPIGERKVLVWLLENGRELGTLALDPECKANELLFSQSGALFAWSSDGESGRIMAWELADMRKRAQRLVGRGLPAGRVVAKGFDDQWVARMLVSPAGDLLAVGTRSGSLQLWDIRANQKIMVLNSEQLAEQTYPPPDVIPVAFSADGAWLATLEDQGLTLRLWQIPSGRQCWAVEFEAPPGANRAAFDPYAPVLAGLAMSPDGRWLALRTASSVRLLELDSGREIYTWPLPKPAFQSHFSQCVAFGPPDGRLLAAGTIDGDVLLLNLGDLPPYSATPAGAASPVPAGEPYSAENSKALVVRGATDGVLCVAFTPDGSQLVAGGLDGVTRTWKIARSGEDLQAPGLPPGWVGPAY